MRIQLIIFALESDHDDFIGMDWTIFGGIIGDAVRNIVRLVLRSASFHAGHHHIGGASEGLLGVDSVGIALDFRVSIIRALHVPVVFQVCASRVTGLKGRPRDESALAMLLAGRFSCPSTLFAFV